MKGAIHYTSDQLKKFHKVYLNSTVGPTSRASKGLRILKDPLKDTRNKSKDEKKHGHKSTQHLIQEVGNFMVHSG
jgi:hypothetical protein